MPCASTFPERPRRSRARCWAAVAAALVGGIVHTPAQTLFRSETNLVALQVTVVDQQRRYVPDLQQQDFSVLEEGQPQIVSLFAAADAPLDLMLLLDTSASMVGILQTARQAAVNIVRRLRPNDRAGLILINERVRIARALTDDAATLERAIREAPISGGTALYDALYVTLKEFSRSRADYQMRRQAMIVLTDGEDTTSHVTFQNALDEARGSSVTIYTIVANPPPRPDDTDIRSRVRFEMRRLAEDSGGRAFAFTRIEDLSGAYDEITTALSHQYWLAYAPGASTGGFRRVAVQIATNPSLRASTRAGYYAAESAATSRTRREPW